MLKLLGRFASLIRLSHTVFALPFALSALVLIWRDAPEKVSVRELALVTLAFTFFRSFAMAFNRLVDADIDARNPRTAVREIPTGRLSRFQVLVFAVLSLAGGFTAAWLLNPLAFYLGFPAVVLLAGYSYAKRFTYLCHIWLGLAIGMAPPAVYVALIGTVPPEALLLFLTLASYIAGFDILYALQDIEFDKANGLHSIPARFGVRGAQAIAAFLHLITTLLLFLLPQYANLDFVYLIGANIIVLLLFLEHRAIGILGEPRIEKIPAAFFNYNSAISIVLFIAIASDVFFVFYAK